MRLSVHITALLLSLSIGTFAQPGNQIIEKTDTSIVKLMYPNQDLKLWYGSDGFKVDNFVTLPKYTILHSRKTSTIRLLANEEMLVLDNSSLLAIKTIRPHSLDGQDVAIGPITPWFTVVNDSTVLAGTAPFKGKNKVSGYVEIAIRQNKLQITHRPFPLEQEAKSGDVDPFKTQFINNYIDYKNDRLLVSWASLRPEAKSHITVNGTVYRKHLNDSLSILYETEKPVFVTIGLTESSPKKRINFIQLLSTDTKLLIYDPSLNQLRTAITDLASLMLIDVAAALPAEDRDTSKFGQLFMYDRVTHQLYYRVSYRKEHGNSQLYMKAHLVGDRLTLTPFLQGDLTDFYSIYVNNHRLFFHDANSNVFAKFRCV